MSRIADALRAIYNFFSGDPILLTATVVAFVAAWALAKQFHANNAAVALVFIAVIALGLVVTVRREVAGRPRAPR